MAPVRMPATKPAATHENRRAEEAMVSVCATMCVLSSEIVVPIRWTCVLVVLKVLVLMQVTRLAVRVETVSECPRTASAMQLVELAVIVASISILLVVSYYAV